MPEPVPPTPPLGASVPPPSSSVPPPPGASVPPPEGASGSFKAPGFLDQTASPVIPSNKDERTMAMVCHLCGIIPFGIIGTIVIWTQKKDTSAFINDQGKEALNFQLNVVIVAFVGVILSAIPIIGCLLSIAVMLVFLYNVVVSIIAGLKANDGIAWRHPYVYRLIK